MRFLRGAVVCAIVLAGGAFAQDEREVHDSLDRLRSHDRVELHPGDPLQIVGMEQGDNDFRARTPALLNAVRTAAFIDPDAAHERAVALYESRAVFRDPLDGKKALPSGEESTRRTPRPAPQSPPEETESSGHTLIWTLPLALVGLIVLAVRRLRGSAS